jgi:hypothetical protein
VQRHALQKSRPVTDTQTVGAVGDKARKALGWPKICKWAHAFLLEHSCKGEKLAQLLGQLDVFLT